MLKGFSTAVFPTETLDDAVIWHLHCTDDGNRLPYPNLERHLMFRHSPPRDDIEALYFGMVY